MAANSTSTVKQALLKIRQLQARIGELEAPGSQPVAIVGAGMRLPGDVDDMATLSALLAAGRNTTREIPRDRWEVDDYYDPEPGKPNHMYTRRASFVSGIDQFDAAFFNISGREAEEMDPQQRLLLETSWEAFERAGIDPLALGGTKTGVFVGVMNQDYAELVTGPGTSASVMSGRIAYLLGVHGPTLTVDTACSSSLVALHLACRSLANQECDLALVGSANLQITPTMTLAECAGAMLSRDGRCKTFDAAADGFGRSDGCISLVLKPLDRAQRDGDPILGVIRGSAVNHGGASGGLLVPSGRAQAMVIRSALADAGLGPDEVDYIEAHGTGTALGDPIELQALDDVYCHDRTRPLIVGSVKSNFGHLEAAAGLAGVLKVLVALAAARIPPHLGCDTLNPRFDWAGSAIAVPIDGADWPAGDRTRRAGVSAFGVSGTNAHVLIEELRTAPLEAVEPLAPDTQHRARIVKLAARDAGALAQMATCYAAGLTAPGADPAAFTAGANTRSDWPLRRAVVARDGAALAAGLRGEPNPTTFATEARDVHDRPAVVFLYPGQGAQYPGMARSLYLAEPVFQTAIDRCADRLAEHDVALAALLWGDRTGELVETRFTQPCVLAVEYALTQLWRSWGIEPDAVIGHSVGEYAAAVTAGMIAIDDALSLIAARGRLLWENCAPGGMIATAMAPDLLDPHGIDPRLDFAAFNAPQRTVIAGPDEALATFTAKLDELGLSGQPLKVSHAFHSAMMTPAMEPFRALCEKVAFAPPTIPVFANVTGERADPAMMTNADYWVRHLREPVRFTQSVQRAAAAIVPNAWIEMGPGTALASLARLAVPGDEAGWLATMRPGWDEHELCLRAAADLYTRGASLDWRQLSPGDRGDVPTYPFQRQRYWVDHQHAGGTKGNAAPLPDDSDWVHAIEWHPVPEPTPPQGPTACLLVIERRADVSSLIRALEADGANCTIADGDDAVARAAAWLAERKCDGPALLIHCCAANGGATIDLDPSQRLVALARLAAAHGQCGLVLLTDGVMALDANEDAARDEADQSRILTGALAAGCLRNIRLELPLGVRVLHIDIATDSGMPAVARDVLSSDESIVLHRQGQRWTERLVPAVRPAAGPSVRRDAAYLVIGGTGAIGLSSAEALIKRGARHVVLAARGGLPPLETDETGQARLAAMRRRGAIVDGVVLDARDPAAVKALVERFGQDLPALAGVVFAAGEADHCPLAELDADRFGRIAGDRVAALWNVHRALAIIPLDFLIIAASLAGIWGAAGSVHYGAANAVADRLARWRDARGLPTLALDWGPWSGGGVAEDAVDQLRRHGLNPLNASHAARLSLDLIGSNAQLVVADVEWDRFIALMGIGGLPSLLREIADDTPDWDGRSHDTALRQTLAILSPAQRRHALARHVEATVRHVLRIADRVEIRHDAPFQSLGMDSLTAIEITQALQRLLDLPLPATTVFDHGRIDALVRKLADDIAPSAAKGALAASATTAPLDGHAPIAVIGMACRFPGGVDGPDALWRLLEEGRVAIDDRPARWDADALIGSPAAAKAAGLSLSLGALDDIRGFDAAFFGIAPREALTMDPQQRLTLETAWLALEHAGVTPCDDATCRTGTYVGVGTNEYGGLLADDPAFEADAAHLPTGNAASVIAGRVAFALGLTGPAVAIDTACSSALVALLQATNDLRRGVCDRALAGGVNVAVTPDPFLMLSRAGMISPSGRCRTFDAKADGYVRGEGCGMVVLKRLADAERDGDTVIGVIHGGAVNQDGRTASLTAPSGPAQHAVIRAALADAGIGADQVGYVEAHGTGTPLGDPIELRALDAVYGEHRGAAGPVRVGSIKTNIGHLEAAAGIAGLFKALLARQHARVPRHVGFDRLNPAIDLDDERMIVAAHAADWPVDAPYAAVSAFGFSGTNAHVVIGPAPPRPTPAAAAADLRLIMISARNDEGLRTMAADLADMLSHSDARLIDVSLATLAGRSSQPVRAAIWGNSRSQIADRLRQVAVAVDATLADTGLVVGRDERRMPLTLDLDGVDEMQLHALASTLMADSATFRDIVGGDVASAADASLHALAIAVGRFLAALGIELGAVSAGPSMRAASRTLADKLEIEQRDHPAAGSPVLSLATLVDSVNSWLTGLAGLFVGGEALRPALLLDGTDAVKVPLPPTRFRRRQFWPTSALRLAGRRRSCDVADEAGSLLPGEPIRSPFDDGIQYRLHLRAESPAHLADHRIFGEVLVAGATHVCAVLEAASRERRGTGSVTLTDITFQQPLSPGDERYVLRTALGAPGADGVRRAQTASRPAHDEDAAWTTHLDARVGAMPDGPAPTASDPEAARAGWPAALPADELYERMHALGYHLGPSFRLLGDGWRRDNVVLRAIRLPEALPGNGDQLLLYPGLIDSCLHAIGECLEGRNDQVDADEIYVPYALSRVTVHRRASAGERLWVEATLRSEVGPGGVPIGDVLLFDATGAVVAELAGFDSRKTTRGALSASRTVTTLLHQLEWEAIDDAADDAVGSGDATPSRRWIVLGADHPVAASAVVRLRAEGRLACVVDLGGPDAGDTERLAAVLDAHPDAAMLCCWSLAEGSVIDRCDRLRVAMTAASGHARSVVVVTIAGQAVVSEDRPDPVQAAVAAMAQAIALEGHAMTSRVIDLADAASAWTIADEAAASTASGDVILARRANRTLARRVDYAPRTVPAGGAPVLAADRTYVVIGGTGALGRLLVGWLAARGARHIALVAPSAGGLGEADRAGLVPDGVEAIGIGADASDRGSLHAAFATMRATMPPVAGMIHAAGLVEDGLLPRQSVQGIARVLAAKADIGANLLACEEAATADFVLFLTSIAGVTGVPGQSNYAAANGYLDALAVIKQADGIAVGALALGPVAGGGMARDAVRKGGFAALDPGELLAAVDRHVHAIVAGQAPPVTLLARVDWTEFAAALPAVAPLLVRLTSANGSAVPVVDLARLRATGGEDGVREWAGDFTRTLVSQALRQPIDAIETDVPLNALGLDSLMAIDLRRHVASAAALDLPMEILLSGATLDSLVLLMGDLALHDAAPDPDLIQEYVETEL